MKRRQRRHSTVPAAKPPRAPRRPAPPKPAVVTSTVSSRTVARIIDSGDTSLIEVVDNLLNRGVVLNAELVLALADVDLVYLRLSALLCAADRLLPGPRS